MSTTTPADAAAPAAADASSLIDALAAAHSQPLWDRYMRLNPPEPRPADAPMVWPWATMSQLVERAVREVSMEDAERRVLLLTHPAFPGTIYTTTNLSGGLQILQPGESARVHRHALAALRLVMMGEGAVTIVDGKRCPMEPGDLVLTPAWTWHEHRHEGKTRMVWFDGLDYPLVRHLGTGFFEMGPGAMPQHGLATHADDALREGGVLPDQGDAGVLHSPLFRYSWKRVEQVLAALPAASDGSRRLRYVNPATGGAVMPTIDCYALRLQPGSATVPVRTTSNAIAVVIEGEGVSQIGDARIAWKQHDVITMPRWQWIEHKATSGPATLFLMTDRDFLSRIGYLREELRGAAQ